jgi:hypothetical protein
MHFNKEFCDFIYQPKCSHVICFKSAFSYQVSSNLKLAVMGMHRSLAKQD